MRFSARERVGLRAMAELAQRYGTGPVSLSEVAAAQEVSLSYLEQVIRPLRRAGLLTSTRGASGGYTLARPPAAITVGDVIRVLEGAIVPIRCVTDQTCSPPCALEDRCATRSVWEIVRDRLTETLDGITLADL
ncbi:MAG: Rrf2 family transcriptional regulator [Chloroflexota bacterium]|nr:MAG: Rrf2 family transcriptional regulator [Chloroflexota bacterium]